MIRVGVHVKGCESHPGTYLNSLVPGIILHLTPGVGNMPQNEILCVHQTKFKMPSLGPKPPVQPMKARYLIEFLGSSGVDLKRTQQVEAWAG